MSRDLEGLRILVTRPKDRERVLVDNLKVLGAEVVKMPAITILPLEDTSDLDRALVNLGEFDWVVFTSVNGVEAVANRMKALRMELASLSERHLAVIGPSTAASLSDHFRAPDLMPTEFIGEAIADALGDVAGQRFLLLRADIARPNLQALLRERGAMVLEVAAYRILPAVADLRPDEPTPHYITLTSAASARAVADALERLGKEHWLRESALVCIGPITADAVRAMGYPVAAVAEAYTADGLLDALLLHKRGRHAHV